MQNEIQKRIEIVAKRNGETFEGLSVKAALDRSYVRKLMERADPQPRRDTMRKMAEAWGVSLAWLEDGIGDIDAKKETSISFSQDVPANHQGRTTPILGRVAASYVKGASDDSAAEVGAVPSPPALASIAGIYALYVDGRSMEPQYFPGDLIFLHPARPPRFGDCVVIITDHGTGEQRSLGILEAEDADTVTLHKRTPDNGSGNGLKIQIPKRHIKARHKVLTVNEMFGA